MLVSPKHCLTCSCTVIHYDYASSSPVKTVFNTLATLPAIIFIENDLYLGIWDYLWKSWVHILVLRVSTFFFYYIVRKFRGMFRDILFCESQGARCNTLVCYRSLWKMSMSYFTDTALPQGYLPPHNETIASGYFRLAEWRIHVLRFDFTIQ